MKERPVSQPDLEEQRPRIAPNKEGGEVLGYLPSALIHPQAGGITLGLPAYSPIELQPSPIAASQASKAERDQPTPAPDIPSSIAVLFCPSPFTAAIDLIPIQT